MKQIRDLLGGDKDGEVEGVALLLRQQGGGRAGRGPNELLGGQGQVPEGRGQDQVPKDVIVLSTPDEVLHPLKFFPAGSRALFLPSPPALCPGPPGQAGGGASIEQFISETNLATALTTSLSDLICKEDRDIT